MIFVTLRAGKLTGNFLTLQTKLHPYGKLFSNLNICRYL